MHSALFAHETTTSWVCNKELLAGRHLLFRNVIPRPTGIELKALDDSAGQSLSRISNASQGHEPNSVVGLDISCRECKV